MEVSPATPREKGFAPASPPGTNFAKTLPAIWARRSTHSVPRRPQPRPVQVSCKRSRGTGNIQAAGDVNVFNQPQRIKTEMARRADAITSAEAREIQETIDELVQWTTGSTRSEAFSHWWNYFKSTFRVEKYEELKSSQMPAARAWFSEQRAIQKRALKTKLPSAWKNERIRAIKERWAKCTSRRKRTIQKSPDA